MVTNFATVVRLRLPKASIRPRSLCAWASSSYMIGMFQVLPHLVAEEDVLSLVAFLPSIKSWQNVVELLAFGDDVALHMGATLERIASTCRLKGLLYCKSVS